jgi:hypothetical protein
LKEGRKGVKGGGKEGCQESKAGRITRKKGGTKERTREKQRRTWCMKEGCTKEGTTEEIKEG